MLAREQGFRFEVLQPADFDRAGRLWARIFGESEPLAVHCGADPDALLSAWSGAYFRAARELGLSLVARRDGTIVAFRFAGDLAVFANPPLSAYLHALGRQVFGSWMYPHAGELTVYGHPIDRIRREWFETPPAGTDPHVFGHVLEMLGVGVAPEFRGLGLGARMTELTQQLAASRGYRWAVVSCTNRHSQKIFEGLDYQERIALEYDALEWNEQFPYRGVVDLDSGRRETHIRGYLRQLVTTKSDQVST